MTGARETRPVRRRRLSRAARAVLAAPALWLALFLGAPLLIAAKLSFSETVLAIPPYEPAFSTADGPAGWMAKAHGFSLAAWRGLFADPLYAQSWLFSLATAALATVCALAIAYPMALAIARSAPRWRPALIGLAIAPFWTSFLIRIYAWIALLKDEGLVNRALTGLGLIAEPLRIFATPQAVLIGMVYAYLPFAILPIYANLAAQDDRLREAAADLGAGRLRTFLTVTLPLSLPAVGAGALLTFIPAVGEFVIPDLLGGSDSLMIGKVLWTDFFLNRDWPAAAAGSIALLALLVGPIVLLERRLTKTEEGR